MNSKLNRQIRNICYAAFLAALGVVLTRFASYNYGFFRLGFGSIPIIISSLLTGPIYGALTGAIADLSGAMMFPSGPYFYGYTIDAALQGIIPYLVIRAFKGRYKYQALYSSFIILCIGAYVIAFVSLYDKYSSKSLNISFNLDTWVKVLIPFIVILYFALLFTVALITFKIKKIHIPSREEKYFSFYDIYLISLTNELFISMSLLGLWNYLFFGLDYMINSFTQLLIFSVNGILRSILLYLLMYPLCKIDPSIASLSQDKHSRNIINN